jgi:hypothetical protein
MVKTMPCVLMVMFHASLTGHHSSGFVDLLHKPFCLVANAALQVSA